MLSKSKVPNKNSFHNNKRIFHSIFHWWGSVICNHHSSFYVKQDFCIAAVRYVFASKRWAYESEEIWIQQLVLATIFRFFYHKTILQSKFKKIGFFCRVFLKYFKIYLFCKYFKTLSTFFWECILLYTNTVSIMARFPQIF